MLPVTSHIDKDILAKFDTYVKERHDSIFFSVAYLLQMLSDHDTIQVDKDSQLIQKALVEVVNTMYNNGYDACAPYYENDIPCWYTGKCPNKICFFREHFDNLFAHSQAFHS